SCAILLLMSAPRPMMSRPPSLSSFFVLAPPLSFAARPRGLSPPRTAVLSQAGARRCCQGWPLLQRPPLGGSAFTASSTTATLDWSGRLHSLSVIYLSSCPERALFRYRMLIFGRPCYEVHGPCDNRINLYPAAPIWLAKVLLAWTIAQEGMGLIFRTADQQRADLRSRRTVTHPTRPTHPTGVSELSALSTLSR